MMKLRIILTLCLGFVLISISAQDKVHLTITGKVHYQLPVEYSYMILEFEENANSCGPNSLFEKLEEQVYHFENDLATAGMDIARFEEVDDLQYYKNQNRRKVFKFIFNTEAEAMMVRDIANDAFAEKITYWSKIVEKNLMDEDEQAKLALKDAIKKMKNYQKALGKKHYDVVHVDDVTSPVTYGLQRERFSLDKIAYEGMELMPYIYNLRVEFELY